MTGTPASGHVYRAISAITAALARDGGIPKTHTNLQDQYHYRSIDDVLAKLAPLLGKHRLCVLPRVLRRKACDRTGEANAALVGVELLVAYDLVSGRDGSRHTIRAFGEAIDPSDKATAKAMSAAYKSAMLQTFCIPASGGDEADASTHRVRKLQTVEREPVQGWMAWSEEIIEIIDGCVTHEALDRMRSRQAALLTAISRERADLYANIGQAFTVRAQELAHPSPSARPSRAAPVAHPSPLIGAEPLAHSSPMAATPIAHPSPIEVTREPAPTVHLSPSATDNKRAGRSKRIQPGQTEPADA